MATLLSSESGVEEWFDFDPVQDQMIVQTKQDVTPILEQMDATRKAELWRTQVKKDMVQFCKLPVTVEMDMMKKGIDCNRLSDPENFKRFAHEITANYPYLLAHHGKRFA